VDRQKADCYVQMSCLSTNVIRQSKDCNAPSCNYVNITLPFIELDC